jgi:hypothetical protein
MTTAMFALTLTAGAQSQTVQVALVHHPVSTTVPAAQEYFDEGLTLVYAFNRDEAARRFTKAAQADPTLAMAWWGVALANGPNLNFDMDRKRVAAANAAILKAKGLEINASPEEVRYVEEEVLHLVPRRNGETARRLSGRSRCGDALRRKHDGRR